MGGGLWKHSDFFIWQLIDQSIYQLKVISDVT